MTAILKVDTIQDVDGNNIINESSDTITIGASGDTTNIIGTLQNNGSALNFATVNGITNAQQWRLTTSFTGNAEPIAANWEEVDTDGYGRLGTTMASVSGIFTFPTTGYWHIISTMTHIEGNSGVQYALNTIQTTENNSSYGDAAVSYNSITENGGYQTTTANFIFDVTDTSTHKVRLKTNSNDTSTTTMGDSDRNRTYLTFIRLGDT